MVAWSKQHLSHLTYYNLSKSVFSQLVIIRKQIYKIDFKKFWRKELIGAFEQDSLIQLTVPQCCK